MATSTHVGDTRALVFPVLCDGHLKIEYDDYNSNDLVGSNTIDTSKHPLWDYGGPFSIEAIITPYDVNGIGHRTSGQGRLDSTKTPPSPNLSLDDQEDTTSNYESVSYFGAGRSTHKMMLFSNSYLKFYLQNTTSSNFNQPAEYKMVVEITDSVGTPITHTIDTDAAVFTSKKSLTGYYDADGFYNGITTDKTKIASSATGSLPTATAEITGNLDSFTNTAAVPATLGTATITVATLPTTSNGALDTTTTAAVQATSTITISSGFSPFLVTNTTSATDAIAVTIRNSNGGGTGDKKRFFFMDTSDFPGVSTGDRIRSTSGFQAEGGGQTVGNDYGYNNDDIAVATSETANTAFLSELAAAINSTNAGMNCTAVYAGSPATSITLTKDTAGTAGNHNGTSSGVGPFEGGSLDSGNKMSISTFSGGAAAVTGSNINEYLTITLANQSGTLTTKRFKFVPSANATANSVGTTQDGTSVVRVHKASTLAGCANALKLAIRHANGFGNLTGFSDTNATHNSNVITLTSPNAVTTNQNNQVFARTTEYTSDSIVTIGSNPFDNFVASTPAVTPTAFITLEDSSGTIKKYKPTKGANSESNGSTATEGSNDVVFFTNVVGDTATTADNLRAVIAGSSGHNGTLTVSRVGSTVTIVAASAGDQAISSTGISSGLTLGAFSTNIRTITVGSGEADGIGAGNSIYDNAGTLIGTVSSVSGNSITLAADPATTVTSTIYRDQQREALYLEQIAKVGISFNKNTLTFYLNNQPVKRVKVNIGKFRLGTSDCYIGQDGSLNAANRKATQFMGELYEIAFHKSANPCASITTLTPNFSDTLLYYTFGD